VAAESRRARGIRRGIPSDEARFWAIGRDLTEKKHSEQRLRELTGRLLHLQEEERRRMARELHDTTVQNLAALGMYLSLVEQTVTTDDPKIRKVLSEVVSLAEQCAKEVRTFSYLLHPPMLDELGLPSALRSYLEGFEKRSGVSVELDLSPELGRMPHEIELTLFRIVQEGLTNIHRHSGSRTAAIRITQDVAEVALEVEDQGRGIAADVVEDVTGATGRIGVGIAGMRERLRQLRGRFEIDSNSRGTTLKAVIPLLQTAAKR
jgi:signal transduction histidine kinase